MLYGDDKLSSGKHQEEHYIGNEVLRFHIGLLLEDVLTDGELGRVAPSCRFALDIPCDMSCH